MAIDFEIAFDQMEWSVLYRVLQAYNFGPSFLDKINMIYQDISSAVINNGNISAFFAINTWCKEWALS